MVRKVLFDHVEVPAENLHAPSTDLDDPDEAAIRYEKTIRDYFGARVPQLDWVLLGLGEDGHLASLFPGSPALEENTRSIIVVRNSPKPPPVRLTMTLPLINQAAQVHILVSGEGKANALRATLEGPADPNRCPAQGVRPTQGTLTWWLDDSAARPVRESALKRDPM
jgi:6-phosphogluconolactonase